jgi:hypothetical protein
MRLIFFTLITLRINTKVNVTCVRGYEETDLAINRWAKRRPDMRLGLNKKLLKTEIIYAFIATFGKNETKINYC